MENFTLFFAKRVVVGVLVAVALLWGVNTLMKREHTASTTAPAPEHTAAPSPHTTSPDAAQEIPPREESTPEVAGHVEENVPETTPRLMEAPPEIALHAGDSDTEFDFHEEESTPDADLHGVEGDSESEFSTAESLPEMSPHAPENDTEIASHMEESPPEPARHAAAPEAPPEASPHADETETPPQAPPHAAEPEASPQEDLHATTPAPAPAETEKAPATADAEEHGSEPEVPLATGVAFVNAVIEPLDHELNHRFWGWRPNDIINVTDNVENYQRGVLEVTRRTVRILTERISRTGSTVAFNPHLENAMNWLMVKSDTYWFPSAEEKYQEALDELSLYREALGTDREAFFTRTDNLIPLLEVFEDLLGSCEENLVKKVEKDGSKVSFFKADDYFFYAKGVASTMHTILEAVEKDFGATIETRKGTDELLSALESLHHACEINPLIVLNSEPGSLFANHRANMAAPISHAKFYLGVLITTLST